MACLLGGTAAMVIGLAYARPDTVAVVGAILVGAALIAFAIDRE